MSRQTLFLVTLALLAAGNLRAQVSRMDAMPESANFNSQASNRIAFIPNRGQLTDQFGKAMPEVLYTLDAFGVKTYFTKGSMHYVFSKRTRTPVLSTAKIGRAVMPMGMQDSVRDSLTLYRVDVQFIGANPSATITATEPTKDYTNYYLPICPDGITHVPAYGRIVYHDLYPHIDLVLYQGETAEEIPNPNNPTNPIHHGSDALEYDFIVHPGGDASAIRIGYDHATSLAVGKDGTFNLTSPFGEVVETKPVGYQMEEDLRESVTCGFALHGNSLTFATGKYDRTRDLYLDPVRIWGTYFGGSDSANLTLLNDLAVDRSGNVNVGGQTNGHNNIATSGAFQVSYGGDTHQFLVAGDAYVASFGPSGNLRWATYYGGDSDEAVFGIACDNSGDVVIAGYTGSKNIPMSSGAFQTTFGENKDGFLALFDSNGTRKWGTYITEGANTQATGVAVDSAQNILVVGWVFGGATHTPDIVTAGAYNSTYDPTGVVSFVAKFTSSGSRSWGTLLGVPAAGTVRIGSDAANAIYVGATWGSTTGILKFLSTGTYRWTTGLGTVNPTQLNDIAVSRFGNVYSVSTTPYTGYATPGAYQIALAGNNDGLLSKCDSAGHKVWVTYYGGTGKEALNRVTVDTGENVYATGTTLSASAIATPGEFQTILPFDGLFCPFLIKFDGGGHRIFGTYYERWGEGWGVGLDRQGHIVLGGTTGDRTGGYATSGAFESAPLGSSLFIAKFCNPIQLHITSPSPNPICQSTLDTLRTTAGFATYQWMLNGAPISSATSSLYAFVTPTVAGTYNYTVTSADKESCSNTSDTFQVVVRPGAIISFPPLNTVCPGSSIKLMTSVSGPGPFIYSWTPRATLDKPDSAQPVATPTATTTYTLTLTDINGCVTKKPVTVAWYAPPKVNAGGVKSTCAGSPIALTATTTSGTGPYNYLWSPAAGLDRTDSSTVMASPSGRTLYTVLVSDQNGCTGKDSVVVQVAASPKVSAGGPLSVCPGSPIKIPANITGAVTTIQWTPATGLSNATIQQPLASPTATTVYTITVTNAAGCSAHDTVRVSVADSLEPTVNAKGPLTVCAGDSLQLSASTGYATYQWSSGEKTDSIVVTKTGDYSVRVTSGGGCAGSSKPLHVTVSTDSIPHPVLVAARDTICAGDSVHIALTGSYSKYLWSTGDSTSNIIVKKSGDYFVTVTNASGCSGASAPVSISVLPIPQVKITTPNTTTICDGDSVSLSATPGYHYIWWNGTTKLPDTNSYIYVKTAGSYSVIAANDGGCDATAAPIDVTVSPTPHPVISGPGSICVNGTGTYTIPLTQGVITWQINPPSLGTITSGQGTVSAAVQWGGTATGALEADVSADGCSGTAQLPITIDAHLSPAVQSLGLASFCDGGSDTLDAGVGYASYQWSKDGTAISGATSRTIVATQSGLYTVYVTNASGCDGTSQSSVVRAYPIPAKPVVTMNGTQLTTSAEAKYQWFMGGAAIAGDTMQTITPTQDGSYSVAIIDANGCTSSSDPFSFAANKNRAAMVELPLDAVQSAATTIREPLLLESSANIFDGTQSTGQSATWVAQVRMHVSEVTPKSPAGTRVGADWIVPLSGTITDAQVPSAKAIALDTIFLLSAMPSSATIECAAILLDTFYFAGKSVAVTTSGGQICVTGACTPWIGNSDTALFIKRISPNPSSGTFTISYHLASDGPLDLVLEDMLGRNASVLKRGWEKSGDYNETYSAEGVASGSYRLVLRSSGRSLEKMVEVAK